MQNRELQKAITTINYISQDYEQTKLEALRVKEEKKQSDMEKEALEAQLEEKDQELDYVYHQLEIRDEENQQLRNYIECDEFFAERGLDGYYLHQFDQQEEVIKDLRDDKRQLQDEVNWHKSNNDYLQAENAELRRMCGQPRRPPEPTKFAEPEVT